MFLCYFLFHSVGVSSTVNSNEPTNRFLLHFQLPFNFSHCHFDLLEGLEVPNTYFLCNLFLYHLVLWSFPLPPMLPSSVALREGSHQIGAAKAIPGLARNVGHVCKSKQQQGSLVGTSLRQETACALFSSIKRDCSACSLVVFCCVCWFGDVKRVIQTLPA